MAGYIGGKVAISSPQQIETKHTITATANQTSIPNIGYTVGAVHVYQNGVRLIDGTDFTATNGSTVTLETGATEGDQIVIVSHGSFETADTVSKASGGTFSGNITVSGSVTANSLVVPDGSIPLVDLDIDGGTDIGAALVDADLMIVDDAAGGTNRKATMARLATYMGTKIGGGLEFISSTDISAGASTVSFTGFDASKYDSYYFTFHNILPQTDAAYLRIRSSSDTSSHSYDSASNNYGNSKVVHGTGASTAGQDRGDLYDSIGTGSGEIGIAGTLEVFNAHLSKNTIFNSFFAGYNSAGNASIQTQFNNRTEDAQVNAVQFFMHNGNFASGTITMYGLVNS